MTGPLRDIRELSGDADAYRDELFRRWAGLLSYRYIGRNHSSMNTGDSDDTMVIRRDMRNAAGGILVAPLAIASPEGLGIEKAQRSMGIAAQIEAESDRGRHLDRAARIRQAAGGIDVSFTAIAASTMYSMTLLVQTKLPGLPIRINCRGS